MFLVFTALLKTLDGQNIQSNEFNIVAEIEERVGNLSEKTLKNRRKNNLESLEKIMLRLSHTAILALTRNEVFADSLTIFQDDDDEEEIGERRELSEARSQYVPTVGLDEILFTVPTYYLIQVLFSCMKNYPRNFHGRIFIQIPDLSTMLMIFRKKQFPIYSATISEV